MDGNHSRTCDGDEWVITGEKYWNTGLHHATHDYIFARTSGEPGQGNGITCFIVPTDSPGFQVEEFMWTFNMPTDHAHVTPRKWSVMKIFWVRKVRVYKQLNFFRSRKSNPPSSILLGAGLHCIDTAVDWLEIELFSGNHCSNQAIQFPLAELYTEAEMIRALIWKTAWQLDEGVDHMEITDKVAMCNGRGNRFCCDAADRAMQTCGGQGTDANFHLSTYTDIIVAIESRKGSEEIQIRKVAGKLLVSHQELKAEDTLH